MSTNPPLALRYPLGLIGPAVFAILLGLIWGFVPHSATGGSIARSCGSAFIRGNVSDSGVAACTWALSGPQTVATLFIVVGFVFLAGATVVIYVRAPR